MKKTLSLVLIAVMLLISLTACNIPTTDGTVTVVIGTGIPTEYTLDYKAEDITDGLLSVLTLLDINYDKTGSFLNSVGDLAPTHPEYIYIYSSVAENADTSSYATTMDYKGTILTSVGCGAKDLHVKDGAIFYIGTITY